MTDHDTLSSYEKKLKYNNAYNRQNYKSFSVRYSIDGEADIIDWLQSKESLKTYLTDLIQKDIAKKKKKELKEQKEQKQSGKEKKKKKKKKNK